jgi:hypothetical protein
MNILILLAIVLAAGIAWGIWGLLGAAMAGFVYLSMR